MKLRRRDIIAVHYGIALTPLTNWRNEIQSVVTRTAYQ